MVTVVELNCGPCSNVPMAIYGILRILLVVVGLLAVIIVLLAVFAEEKLVFPGSWSRPAPDVPDLKALSGEIWKHCSTEAIFIPAHNAAIGSVIYAHGNGELIDDWIHAFGFYYNRLNLNLLLVEYKGYGRSPGQPNQESIREDFVAFYDQLKQRTSNQAGPNITLFHGRSLGGGVIADLLSQRNATHLILESTFTRLTDRAFEIYKVPSFLIRNRFETIDVLSRGEAIPTLVIHGLRDAIIPISHGKKLFASLKGPKNFFEFNGGHNDPPVGSEDYVAAIEKLIKTANSR